MTDATASSIDDRNSDAIIAGAGIAGLVQALALARHGLRVTLVDRHGLAPREGGDPRVSTLGSVSWAMVRALGLGEPLAGDICAVHKVSVNDRLEPGRLDFTDERFEEHGAFEDEAMAVTVENAALRAHLVDAVQAEKKISVRAPATFRNAVPDEHRVVVALEEGRSLVAPLLIGADGRASPVRESAGIAVARWDYAQSAVTCMLKHDEPHSATAFQIFYDDGPIALLPMRDAGGAHRSSLVWTVKGDDAAKWARVNERAFLAEVTARTGGFLGKLSLASERAPFPLGFHQSATLVGDRVALIGDAGQAVHPIAGQGLNLGLRDVAALTQVLVEAARTGLDPGHPTVLERYDRWRGADRAALAAATDGLARAYGARGRGAAAVRGVGMKLLDAVPPVKRGIVAVARGEAGDLPDLLRGELV